MPGCKVTFLPQNATGVFEEGTNVRDAALDLGILIDSTCAGIGTCGRCKVEVKAGVNEPTPVERQVLSRQEIEKGVRLSCQAAIEGDATCLIPDSSLALIENIAIDGVAGEYELDPEIKFLTIDVPRPDLADAGFLEDLAARKLEEIEGRPLRLDLHAIRMLAAAIRKSRTVTATIDFDRVTGFRPGPAPETLFGVAVDIGTTTMAAKLLDLGSGSVIAVSTAANPQAAIGADVVTRIQYTVRHTGGLRKMSKLVIGRINEMVGEMTREAGIKGSDVAKIVIVGNTVMQHLLLSVDPRELGVKPYTSAFAGPITVRASELGMKAGPDALVYCAPNLSSYVGSDITAVLVALRFQDCTDPTLVVDMGTNGEMVLTDGDRMLCCSSPAGPAWEGACIHYGMRAARGAIERLEIEDDGTVDIRTVGESSPIGICGSGLIDTVSALLDKGLLGLSGRLNDSESLNGSVPDALRRRLFTGSDGVRAFSIAPLDDNQSISLSQSDIRQVQLAKAGIASGIMALMDLLDVAPSSIQRALVAGAFGNHLRGEDVARLGLIPNIEHERIQFVGNAAMAGAEAMLRSRAARIEAERIARRIEYVEIAGQPGFEDNFVESIPFPDETEINQYMPT